MFLVIKKPSFSLLQKIFLRNKCTILIYEGKLSCYVAKLLIIIIISKVD